MEHSAEALPRLTAAPQHLRRRRLHGEIPDPLLVPDAQPLPLAPERPLPGRAAPAKRAAGTALKRTGNASAAGENPTPPPGQAPRERKRTVALALVILVSLSIPALALALIFAG